jgi:hypothetical protein
LSYVVHGLTGDRSVHLEMDDFKLVMQLYEYVFRFFHFFLHEQLIHRDGQHKIVAMMEVIEWMLLLARRFCDLNLVRK